MATITTMTMESILKKDIYVKATGDTKKKKAVVEAFVDSVIGDTKDEKATNLPLALKHGTQMAVDYVQAHLPLGVERVDGALIRPILAEVVKEKTPKEVQGETSQV